MQVGSEPYCSVRMGSNGEATEARFAFSTSGFRLRWTARGEATGARRAPLPRRVQTQVVEGDRDRCLLCANGRSRCLIASHGVLHFASVGVRRVARWVPLQARRASSSLGAAQHRRETAAGGGGMGNCDVGRNSETGLQKNGSETSLESTRGNSIEGMAPGALRRQRCYRCVIEPSPSSHGRRITATAVE